MWNGWWTWLHSFGSRNVAGTADGGCGGSEVKCKGNAEKAADPAMRGDFTTSSRLDGTSTTKKGKKRKSATRLTLTTSGLGSGWKQTVWQAIMRRPRKMCLDPKDWVFQSAYPQSWIFRKSPLLSHACPSLLLPPTDRGFLGRSWDSQRVPVHPENEDMELNDEPDLEQELDERDPDYVPHKGDEDDEGDTSDDEIRRAQPCIGKDKSDRRGKVARTPRARQLENQDGEVSAVTCLMPDCPFSGSNVMWHLRGQPHVFSEAQIQHILKGDVVKRPRLMTKVACPLQGQAMTAAYDRVCQTSANIRLDLHLPKHGLYHGTQEWDRVYQQAIVRARGDARQVQGDFDLMVEQYLFRREGSDEGRNFTG